MKKPKKSDDSHKSETPWMEEVLPKMFSGTVQLVKLYGVRVPSTLCKTALTIVAADDWLRKSYPHLKRVKPIRVNEEEIAINEVQDITENQNEVVLLLGNSPDIPNALISVLEKGVTAFLVDVPAAEPLTRQQYLEWNKIWPVSYRQPSWRPIYFLNNARVKASIFRLLKRIACFQSESQCAISCVLALSGVTVSEAFIAENSSSKKHPLLLGHAPIVALQRLSRYVIQLQETERNISLVQQHPDKRARFGRRGAPQSLNKLESTELLLRSTESHKRPRKEVNDSSEANSSVCPPANSDSLFISSTGSSLASTQYYAQGLVALVSSEPCVMCSMALLHSRIECVVIPKYRENTRFGGLGGLFSLHTDGRLNHKFHVLYVDLQS